MITLILKRLLLIFAVIMTLPLMLVTWLEAGLSKAGSRRVYGSCKELLALCPTVLGEYFRAAFYWAVCANVSPKAKFLFGSMVAHRDTIIHPGAVIGVHTIIGHAEIGRNVLLGARVSIMSGKYQHGRPSDKVEGRQVTSEYKKVYIGENSWIGEGALVMANVGENCTVGAGSVVYKDVPDHTTVLGNPARKVSL